MGSTPQPAPDYILGVSEEERARLSYQAAILRPFTARLFERAGLTSGMRVLDVGCGLGDVAFLASEMVGPEGLVIAIDRDQDVLARARARTDGQRPGCAPVRFVHSTLESFSDPQAYDAVVGRYVLVHQKDPAQAVRTLASHVRAGGLIVFHELDMGSPFFTYPPVTTFDNAARCACLAFERSGLPHDVGRRLGSLYTAAGLPFPELMAEIPVGGPGSAITGWAVQTLRTLLPMIEQLGIATAAEIGIDTLRQRIEADAREKNAVLTGPPQFGAWARKP